MDELKYLRKLELELEFNKLVVGIVPNTPPHEMASWGKQEHEARAWDADNSAPTPMIDIMLVSRDAGESKEELVHKIIDKASAYQQTYADYLGRFHKVMRLVEEATTEEELKAISF